MVVHKDEDDLGLGRILISNAKNSYLALVIYLGRVFKLLGVFSLLESFAAIFCTLSFLHNCQKNKLNENRKTSFSAKH